MNINPTALKRQTKDTLITKLLEANEDREALTARYLIVFCVGLFLGYALTAG